MNRTRWIILVSIAAIAFATLAYVLTRPSRLAIYSVEVVETYPHDPQAFTQGLFYHEGTLYEGTGEVGESDIRKVRLENGQVAQAEPLPAPYFGEGIVAWKDRIYQLTWQDQKGFVYDLKSFALRGSFDYKGEGWGLTHNGKYLIMSDGTATLRFLDPETMKQVSTLAVTADGCPVVRLNELEWVDGQIYANIWQSDLIARIDPESGKVTSFLDVGALGPAQPEVDDVANGIAYDAGRKRLFVTGKNWPQLYEVREGTRRIDPDAVAAVAACPAK